MKKVFPKGYFGRHEEEGVGEPFCALFPCGDLHIVLPNLLPLHVLLFLETAAKKREIWTVTKILTLRPDH
jgi:hypothetical protein